MRLTLAVPVQTSSGFFKLRTILFARCQFRWCYFGRFAKCAAPVNLVPVQQVPVEGVAFRGSAAGGRGEGAYGHVHKQDAHVLRSCDHPLPAPFECARGQGRRVDMTTRRHDDATLPK